VLIGENLWFNMRAMLVLLLFTSILCAQEQAAVEVVKSSWSKVRIGWERDPFGGPLENFDEMRSRARNERRIAQGGGERARREAKADEANLAKQREKAPPKYYFIYKTRIKNNPPQRQRPQAATVAARFHLLE
jgi:hypothetical protein